MIGRAAMSYPWVFREAKHYVATGEQPSPVPAGERWDFILRHIRMATEHGRYGAEKFTVQAMRSRLMAYSKGLPAGRRLRERFCHMQSIMELEDLAAEYLSHPRWQEEEVACGEDTLAAVN
jgi:tRNA-dihydrouridine synthase